jgi:transposase InsO family protein
MDCRQHEMIGIDDEREALVMKDLHPGNMHIYPDMTKNTSDTVQAIHHWKGMHAIKLLYSDGSGELRKACAELSICHETSQPGLPQNNGIIERANQDIQIGTAACLLQESSLQG